MDSQKQLVVPLHKIQNLSIGQFPLSMNPAGLNVLVLNFQQNDETSCLLLAPMEGWFARPKIWNVRIEEWYQAIRHAASQRTGTAPPMLPQGLQNIPKASNWWPFIHGVSFLLPYFLLTFFYTAVRGGPGTNGWKDYSMFMLSFGFSIGLLYIVFWRLVRGRSDTSNQRTRSGSTLLLIAAIFLAVSVSLSVSTWNGLRTRLKTPTSITAIPESLRAKPDSSPQSRPKTQLPPLFFVAGQNQSQGAQTRLEWFFLTVLPGRLHGSFGTNLFSEPLQTSNSTQTGILSAELSPTDSGKTQLRLRFPNRTLEQEIAHDPTMLAQELLASAQLEQQAPSGHFLTLGKIGGNLFQVMFSTNPSP